MENRRTRVADELVYWDDWLHATMSCYHSWIDHLSSLYIGDHFYLEPCWLTENRVGSLLWTNEKNGHLSGWPENYATSIEVSKWPKFRRRDSNPSVCYTQGKSLSERNFPIRLEVRPLVVNIVVDDSVDENSIHTISKCGDTTNGRDCITRCIQG